MRSFLLLLIIVLLSSYALFHPSFFHVHDYTHAARIVEMQRSLDAGQFPVRWSDNFGFGFGMPLFNFYAPLPYFLGALLLKLGFSAVTSIKLLYMTTAIFSSVGAYFFGRQLLGRFAGVIMAAAYTLAPYRAVNLFVRGALSEAFAMAFFPFVLWAITAYFKSKNRTYLLYLTLGLTGIILSHNLSALMFFPLALLFGMFSYFLSKQNARFWDFFWRFPLAACLGAFYILPAFLEKDYTAIDQIFTGYFHYSHHFLYIRQFFTDNWSYGGSSWGPEDGISFFLGLGQLIGLVLTVGLVALSLVRRGRQALRETPILLGIFFGFSLLGSLFISILKSQFLWDSLPLLPYIQFPWRFLSLSSLSLAMLAAFSLYFFKRRILRFVFGLILISLIGMNYRYFRPQTYLDEATSLYYIDASKIQTQMSDVLPDYIPKQMISREKLLTLGQTLPTAWIDEAKQMYTITPLLDRGFEKMFAIEVEEPALLNIKVAAFPGWRAEIDGQEVKTMTNQEIGNLQVPLEEGDHKVSVYFGEFTLPRQIGDALSLLSLAVLFYLHSPFIRKQRKNDQAD